MKPFFYVALAVLAGCNNPVVHTETLKVDTAVVRDHSKSGKVKPFISADSIIIASKYFDTIVYSKEEFNEIVDNFPELYDSFQVHPDISYARSGMFRKFTDSAGKEKTISFSSEVGQDCYYILYAYFLQKQNGVEVVAGKRDTLIRIYREINHIFGWLQHGGTYFGHQYSRINGYAEFGLYQYKYYYSLERRTYSISRQKKLYLALLRQKISDETQTDHEIMPSDKVDQLKKLFKSVTILDHLITDYFYLELAQEFQYSNY